MNQLQLFTARKKWEMLNGKTLTVKTLAKLMGIAPATAYRWEKGQTVPSVNNIRKLCEILQTTISELVPDAPSAGK